MKKNNSDEKLVEQYIPRDPGLVARFLGVKTFKQRTINKTYPIYKTALYAKAFSEAQKNYEVRSTFNLSWGAVVSPSYKHLEVGRGKNEELLIVGYNLLLKKTDSGNIPLVTHITPNWYGDMELYIMYGEKHSAEALEFIKYVEDYMADNNFYKGEKIDVTGKFLDIEDIDFEDVVLPEQDKKSIKVGALEFFNKKEIYEKNKIPFKRGMIFTGPPGTGKTLTGRLLMNKSDCTFLWVTSDMVEKASDIKRLFKMAKELTPCILFMEDIDDYLEKSGAVDVLKTQMDGMDGVDGICTIICTNFPERLPMALIDRPSRFDDVIEFKLPDYTLRYKILNRVGKYMEIDNREEVLKDLAKETDGLTGAHLKEIMVYALLLSADEDKEVITENHLAIALLKVQDTKNRVTDGFAQVDVKALVKDLKARKESEKEKK